MRSNTGFICHAHRNMVSYEMHHVWPVGYHGPDEDSNKVKICPNAHSDIHYLMNRMLAGKSNNLNEYGASVSRLARSGYDQVTAYADSLIG